MEHIEKLHIASACDENYIQPLAVMLTSLINNTAYPENINFYLVDCGIAKSSREYIQKKFGQNIKVNIVNPDMILVKDFATRGLSSAAYAKILIPGLIKSEKILMIDCDLIFTDDVYKLWSMDINDFTFLAQKSKKYKNALLEFINDNDFFNSGVMLIDGNKWRKSSIENEALDFLIKNSKSTNFHDQDALIYSTGKLGITWASIPQRWHIRTSTVFFMTEIELYSSFADELKKSLKNPGIIHYNLPLKPWHQILPNRFKNSKLFSYYYNNLNKLGITICNKKTNIQDGLYLFGAGDLGAVYAEALFDNGIDFKGFIDNDIKKQGKLFCNKRVFSLDEVFNKNIKIVISSMFRQEIGRQLNKRGLRKGKEYFFGLESR